MIEILAVDDDAQIRAILEEGLSEADFECRVQTVADGPAGLKAASEHQFDAVILDVQLPGMNGFDVLRALRDRGNDVPVLLLTGTDDESSVVRGLREGADDYVTKPFNLPELQARVEAVVRRARMASNQTLSFGDVEVDVVGRRAMRAGRRLSLTPTEFDLLVALLRADGTMSRDDLLQSVWEMDFDPGTNLLDVHLSRLRTKLEANGRSRVIQTVRGKGFRLGEAED